MILEYPLKRSPTDFSIAKLFGRSDLTQGEKVQLGTRMETWFNFMVDNHKDISSVKGKNSSKLWMNIETNELILVVRVRG